MDPDYTNYQPEESSLFSKLTSGIIELIEFLAVVLAILLILRFFIAEPHKVSGHSMVPNFQDGDYLITNKLATRSAPQREEVIILKNPNNLDQVFIKRIIGLPGEQIKIQNGNVYINGRMIAEPYLPSGLKTEGETYLTNGEEITIPGGQFFVMGDNRHNSSDSREWGPVKQELVVGQAWLRYWPPQSFGLIKIGEISTYR